MSMKFALRLAICTIGIVISHISTAAAAGGGAPDRGPGVLPLIQVVGGALQDPVISGDLVYVPSGRIVSTWDYSNPSKPVLLASTSTAPVSGQIHGLTRWGKYLYASWQAGDGDAGVAVYSLRNARQPELVNEVRDYGPQPQQPFPDLPPMMLKRLYTLAAANGYLYLFDAENGIYYGDLARDPLNPTFARMESRRGGAAVVPYTRSFAAGNRIFISGKTFSSMPFAVCNVLDVSQPAAPVFLLTGCGGGDELEFFRTRVQFPLSAAYGLKLSLLDVSNPDATHMLGSIDTAPATDGFIAGNYAYSLGFAGIDIHDISNPLAPATVGHSSIPTLGTESVSMFGKDALLLTSTDRFTRVDVSDPLVPVAVSTAVPIGGAFAKDIAVVKGKGVVLHQDYGLSIVDPRTLAPLARFEPDLPEGRHLRSYEQLAIDGNRAYLVAWGYGLIIVDLSNPLRPRELGRLPFEFASSVAVSGNTVFIGRVTNGGLMWAVDVSDPANPVPRGTGFVGKVNRLQAHGKYLYVADDLAGVHIFYVGNPDRFQQVALWRERCRNNVFIWASDIELSADGKLAAVACGTGLQLVDLRKPLKPAWIGGASLDYTSGGGQVALRGNRAWYADHRVVREVDISNPAAPRVLGEDTVAVGTPIRLRALDDGRMLTFFPSSGVHVYGRVTGR